MFEVFEEFRNDLVRIQHEVKIDDLQQKIYYFEGELRTSILNERILRVFDTLFIEICSLITRYADQNPTPNEFGIHEIYIGYLKHFLIEL